MGHTGGIEHLQASGRHSYPVVIDAEPGAEGRLAAALHAALPDVTQLALVTDENVAQFQLPRFTPALAAAGFQLITAVVPPGEGAKRLAVVEQVAEALLAGGIDRRSGLLALGGGVVSDLGGFVAATLLRGIPWAVAPTTLLSQVDAALGGKTAVNLPLGKNLVGAFHDPHLMYVDLGTLRTLPERERVAGLGEVLKHALLLGEEEFAALDAQAEAARRGEPALLRELVASSCRYKARVVGADPEERDPAGGRALLNLGHTVGHALETASAGALLHGEAVALGLMAMARVSARLVPGAADLEDRLLGLLPRLGLPADLDRRLWGPDGAMLPRVAAALGVDKKRAGGQIRFVALGRPGEARLIPLSVAELLPLLRPADVKDVK